MKTYLIEPHLKSLWKPRVLEKTGAITFKRSTQLIVPEMEWNKEEGKGDLNVSDWAYDMRYAFRSSLDLSYDTRRKTVKVFDDVTGEPVMVEETGKQKTRSVAYEIWTQGFRIDFKQGDLLRSNKGFKAIQVQSATAMDWDEKENKMFEGVVNYEIFENVKFGHIGDVKTVSQMEFLMILVNGN